MIRKIFIVIFSLLIFGSIYYFVREYNLKQRNAVDKLVEKNKLINILIAGRNTFFQDKNNFYAIFSFYPETKKIGLTFIPPSFQVDLDNKGNFTTISEIGFHDFKKISAYLQRKMKIKIPFYFTIYGPDVERGVDLLEGVNLFILNQGKNVDNLKFGLNYLDGAKTLKYINSAPENSIFEKYDRIQDVLLTLYFDKDKYSRLLNLEFISEMLDTIKTNLLPQEIFSLIKLMMKESSIMCTILPGSINEHGNYVIDELSYKIYKQDFLKYLVYKYKSEKPVKVKILNGTNIPGLAKRVRKMLIKEGVTVVEFGTSPFPPIEKSVIINQKGDISDVKKISALTGIEKIHHVIDSSELHSVLLIIGKDMHK